jgi:hypothetical protein
MAAILLTMAAVFWLGSCGFGFLSVDWILVQSSNCHFCQYEGIFG